MADDLMSIRLIVLHFLFREESAIQKIEMMDRLKGAIIFCTG